MLPPSDAGQRRVVLRDVADAANVSLMTASLSIRNSPKISAATRARVRTIAQKLGYRPDPELSRLMVRLRLSRTTRFKDVIATIDWRPADAELHPYEISLRRGIALRADELGFQVSHFRLRDYNGNLSNLLRVIRNRGTTGIILLPANQPPVELDPKANWDGLSVLSATTGVMSPRFHQVVPNALYNIMAVIDGVQKKGYRRIGAVIGEALEQRTAHHYSLALTWHGHGDRILIVPASAKPAEANELVRTWVRKHEPDVVLAQDGDSFAEQLKAAGMHRRVHIVSLSNRTDSKMPYQDQMPQLIGESAVSHLTGMMHNNETGIPKHAHVTTVDGVFRDPQQKRRAAG